MKSFSIILLLSISFGLSAQNWTLFPFNQETYFEFESNANYNNYGTAPYYVDSITNLGNSTEYHILGKYFEDNYAGFCKEDYFQQSNAFQTLDHLRENNNEYVFSSKNYPDVPLITFKHNATVGESWTAYQPFTNVETIQITCDSIGTVNFLGISDNAKYFSVQYIELGVPTEHEINEARYVLTENHGFIEFVPFYYLQSKVNYQGTVIGMEDNGNFLGVKRTLDFVDFLKYETGDAVVREFATAFSFEEYLDTYIFNIDSLIVTDSIYQMIGAPGSGIITYNLTERNSWLENSFWGFGFDANGSFGSDYFKGISISKSTGENNEPVYSLQYYQLEFWNCSISYECYSLDYFNTQDGYTNSYQYCDFSGFIEETEITVIDIIKPGDAKFYVKVFFEGASTTNTIELSSLLNELIPLEQPYNFPPYNYEGTETMVEVSEDYVDWVLLEVRTGTPNLIGEKGTTTIATKAAMLNSNGELYDVDGERGVFFEGLTINEDYYFCIRHRNHLDVLSATPLNGIAASYDFTFSTEQAFGVNQQKYNNQGYAAMYAGDFNHDGVIQTTDYDAWQNAPAQNQVYSNLDATLDGVVQATDYDLWFFNKAKLGSIEIGF